MTRKVQWQPLRKFQVNIATTAYTLKILIPNFNELSPKLFNFKLFHLPYNKISSPIIVRKAKTVHQYRWISK
ncbi:hypothetical protein MTR_4g053195 [Medicago truncatula]|uniref:Uncharacterized protein n=1 Tax=Medicago truncatula TaxID=3880 RepID=A0A072UJP7_MEDTR|nr:hypothetical protein MTR_4g053195 [Medicago truncatula]